MGSSGKPQSPDAARATAALAVFDRAFYVGQPGGLGYDKLTTQRGRSDFWRQARMMVLAADAYQSTHDPAYEAMVEAMRGGIASVWGRGGNPRSTRSTATRPSR